MVKRRHQIPVIGITGSIGSGKSTVSEFFRRWGAAVVSGDETGRKLVDNSKVIRRQLVREFGEDIIGQGDVIDRPLLARRAFATTSQVSRFNRIVHPLLIRDIKRQVHAAKAQGHKAVVIDAALLVEAGVGHIPWDVLVAVWAPYKSRVSRLKRRGLTTSQIRRFSRAQAPWHVKRRLADHVILNDASRTILQRRSRLCWLKMLSSGPAA